MAKKAKQSSSSHVTRISASEPTEPKKANKATETVEKAPKLTKPKAVTAKRASIFASIWGYFRGSWDELRQVRWPNRRATWSLTGAVILFTSFFVLIILLLDAAFKYLFELILV